MVVVQKWDGLGPVWVDGNLLVSSRQQPGRREGIHLSMGRARTCNLEQGMDKLRLQRKRKPEKEKM